jgi:hypothetical protein
MNDLTPSYEPETGEVILDGRLAGPAGEAGLVPVAGVELAFDRVDGHLVRAIVDAAERPATVLLTRLLGPQVMSALRGEAEPDGAELRGALSPEAGLCAALSSLARLDATRATSPVPASSPWWSAEAAVLAERAGLHARAVAEARRAVRALGRGQLLVPGEAASIALAAADIAADPDAARRLQENIVVVNQPDPPRMPGLDIAAEVESLQQASVRPPGLRWVLDPDLAPPGVFRPGLSPYSDLLVHLCADRVVVQAALAADADPAAARRCQVRLVDPVKRRVLGCAGFEEAGSTARAQLQLASPLDGDSQTWIEVVDGKDRPVRSAKLHLIRRALRWADAALRAKRAPVGLAPQSASEDWAALAALAWDRCRRDWEAAGDQRQVAAVLTPWEPLPGPACLAEVMGE